VILDKITLLLFIYQIKCDLELVLQLTWHLLLLLLRLLSLLHIELCEHVLRYPFFEISKFIFRDALVFLAILSITTFTLASFKHLLEDALDLVFRVILIYVVE
jgi:hypothetical protein